jgi:hypothetical protein
VTLPDRVVDAIETLRNFIDFQVTDDSAQLDAAFSLDELEEALEDAYD